MSQELNDTVFRIGMKPCLPSGLPGPTGLTTFGKTEGGGTPPRPSLPLLTLGTLEDDDDILIV